MFDRKERTVEELKELIEYKQRIIDKCIYDRRPIPLNYVLEARHYRIQVQIKRLQAEIKPNATVWPDNHPKRIRLQILIAQATEIGAVNRMMTDFNKYNHEVFIADR